MGSKTLKFETWVTRWMMGPPTKRMHKNWVQWTVETYYGALNLLVHGSAKAKVHYVVRYSSPYIKVGIWTEYLDLGAPRK